MRRQSFGTILVGPHSLLREGLIHILCAAKFRILASVASMSDLAAGPLQRYDRILLIIESGSDPSSVVPQIALFKQQHPHGRVAVLGRHHRPADMVAAFQAGANVYFDSEEARDAFIKALELVMLGETILPPELLSYVRDTDRDETPAKIQQDAARTVAGLPQVEEGDWPQLSVRESSILRCIIEGASNKVIARKIDITEATVKVHVKAILRKVRVRNRTQAAIWAMNHASHIWQTDNGHHPAKTPAALALTPRQGSLPGLAARDLGDAAGSAAVADGDGLVERGLNGNASLIAGRVARRRRPVPEKQVEAGSARNASRPDAPA